MLKKHLKIALYALYLCVFVLMHTACPQTTNPAREPGKESPGFPTPDTAVPDTGGPVEPDDSGNEEDEDDESDDAEGEGEEEEEATLLTVKIIRETGIEGEDEEILLPADVPFCSFALKLVHDDGTSLPERIIPAGASPDDDQTSFPLKSGEWTVTVTGFIDADDPDGPFAAARGTAMATIQAGKPLETAVVLGMNTGASEKQGFFTYDVAFPEALVNTAALTITAGDDGEASLSTAAVNLLETGREPGVISLIPGLYRMELSLSAGYIQVNRTAILRVYPGLKTASPRYIFTEEDFSQTLDYSSVEALMNGLENLPENNPDDPYPVTLRGIDLSGNENSGDTLKNMHTVLAAGKRYVDLDLSGCFGVIYASDSDKSSVYVTSLKLPESVKTIGENAFAKYKDALISVEMPEVTSIGWGAFSDCAKLMTVTAPKLITIEGKQNTKNKGDGAFYGCTSLTTVSLPLVQTIGDYAFYECTGLSSIHLPSAKTIKRMVFKECGALNIIELPEVTSIGHQAFYSIPNQSRIILGSTPPEWDSTTSIFSSSFRTAGEIFVPAEAVSVYAANANWKKFIEIIYSLDDMDKPMNF